MVGCGSIDRGFNALGRGWQQAPPLHLAGFPAPLPWVSSWLYSPLIVGLAPAKCCLNTPAAA